MERLSSWKEIAGYLGVTVRTAQLWERDRNLPVQRLPGPRSQVTALKADLDRWRESANALDATETHPEVTPSPALAKAQRPMWARPFVSAVVVVVIVLSVVLVGLVLRPRPGPPALFHNERQVLIVTDEHGRELWRHRFPFLLDPNAEKVAEAMFWSGDFDNDGDSEVVYVAHPIDYRAETATLNFFSVDGKLKWTYTPGRTVRSSSEVFEGAFYFDWIKPVTIAGRKYIAAGASHNLWYPNQIVVLTGSGEVRGEYWHSGRLTRVAVADLDNNGTDELYLGGVNNGTKSAELVVLDADRLSGASREPNSDYQLLGFAPGHERARILFPRSCVNHLTEPYNAVMELSVNPRTITLGLWERFQPEAAGNFYELKHDLSLKTMTPGSGFLGLHRRMETEGQLSHAWTESERDQMEKLVYLGPSNAPTEQQARLTARYKTAKSGKAGQ